MALNLYRLLFNQPFLSMDLALYKFLPQCLLAAYKHDCATELHVHRGCALRWSKGKDNRDDASVSQLVNPWSSVMTLCQNIPDELF